ncbi:MAG: DUF2283 domain-containing protein [Candidatus Acetothermia bacterium]|jgi:uncharacterized protein YuzE|nr:DUF2283 domain-containing protein [Candidatus Acetothermia bacterium]MDH7505988.1 DUF2283 domain-containing protein [Candidatus Acetothermia bacterium]
MEAIKLFEKRPREALNWDYDGEADVLYLSFGDPRAAVGVDIGEGVVLRYDEEKGEVVGLTILGLGAKLLSLLGQEGKEAKK